jgi:hypothetical protein
LGGCADVCVSPADLMLRPALQHPCAIAQEQAESKLAKASVLSTADEIAKALHLTISLSARGGCSFDSSIQYSGILDTS